MAVLHVSSAQPAPVFMAMLTCHVVAARDLLSRSFALWTLSGRGLDRGYTAHVCLGSATYILLTAHRGVSIVVQIAKRSPTVLTSNFGAVFTTRSGEFGAGWTLSSIGIRLDF